MSVNWPPKPKILYAFQGTGNGHASRAEELVPILQKHAVVDVLCSGLNSQLKLPFKIDFQFEGLSFYYNRTGGLDYFKSARKARLWRFYKEVKSLDLSSYDLILNDFEPVSAYAARSTDKPCVALSHQASFLSKKSPRPLKKDAFAEWVFRNYAPTKYFEGFHFKSFDAFIHPPILRKQIQELEPRKEGYYLVYLPAYSEEVLKSILTKVSNVEWLVFSKESSRVHRHHNVEFRPISSKGFQDRLANCDGLLCSAGFEAPAEALYLGKKLFVVPIKGQYEQDCNAQALKEMGVPSCKDLNIRSLQLLEDWVYQDIEIPRLAIADAEKLMQRILKAYSPAKSLAPTASKY